MQTATIFVYLADEQVDCWRPVQAVSEGDNRYRIVSVNADPDDEHWQFTTGEFVEYEQRVLSGDEVFVAVRRAT